MSGALAAGLLTLAVMRPDTRTLTALAAAITGFATAMLRPDTQGAMPFVDRVLMTSFDVHLAAGIAVISGSLILLMPAVIGRREDQSAATIHAVFGAGVVRVIAAAALGNYPTPLVGYGGSAILGYLLCSVALLTRTATITVSLRLSPCHAGTNRRSWRIFHETRISTISPLAPTRQGHPRHVASWAEPSAGQDVIN